MRPGTAAAAMRSARLGRLRAILACALALMRCLVSVRGQWSGVQQFDSSGLVRVQDEHFVDGLCQEFLFTGWNTFEVLESALGKGKLSINGGAQQGRQALEFMMAAARDAHMSVVRFFAHGTDGNLLKLRPGPETWNEEALIGLDTAIAIAKSHGVRVILSLINNWDISDSVVTDTKSKYASWSPTADDADDFWTDPFVKERYRELLAKITSRVNTITGAPYRTDPTILAWNLINEPRCNCNLFEDPDSYACSVDCAEDLSEWINEMSLHLKSLDPYHLVTVGEEGFWSHNATEANLKANPDWDTVERLRAEGDPDPEVEFWARAAGQNFTQDHSYYGIDFASFHSWLPNWGRGNDLQYFKRWMNRHIDEARFSIRKPAVLQEFGQTAGDGAGAIAEERDPVFQTVYERLLKDAREAGSLKGAMFWLWEFGGGSRDEYGVRSGDSTFWRIIRPSSEALSRALNARPLVSNCFPMAQGLYSLQMAFAHHTARDYYYSSGEKTLAESEGEDVPLPDGSVGARNVSANDCATLCSLQDACTAFSYNPWNWDGECYLKTGSSTEVQFSEYGWQTFWRVPESTYSLCSEDNCAVCTADGSCLRCQQGFVFSRTDRRCTPCARYPQPVQQTRAECAANPRAVFEEKLAVTLPPPKAPTAAPPPPPPALTDTALPQMPLVSPATVAPDDATTPPLASGVQDPATGADELAASAQPTAQARWGVAAVDTAEAEPVTEAGAAGVQSRFAAAAGEGTPPPVPAAIAAWGAIPEAEHAAEADAADRKAAFDVAAVQSLFGATGGREQVASRAEGTPGSPGVVSAWGDRDSSRAEQG